MDLSQLALSSHGRRAMEERAVPWADVVEAVRRPHLIEPHQGRRRFVRGDLVVVVADDDRRGPVVVTVLWRRPERWTSDAMAQGRAAS